MKVGMKRLEAIGTGEGEEGTAAMPMVGIGMERTGTIRIMIEIETLLSRIR